MPRFFFLRQDVGLRFEMPVMAGPNLISADMMLIFVTNLSTSPIISASFLVRMISVLS